MAWSGQAVAAVAGRGLNEGLGIARQGGTNIKIVLRPDERSKLTAPICVGRSAIQQGVSSGFQLHLCNRTSAPINFQKNGVLSGCNGKLHNFTGAYFPRVLSINFNSVVSCDVNYAGATHKCDVIRLGWYLSDIRSLGLCYPTRSVDAHRGPYHKDG